MNGNLQRLLSAIQRLSRTAALTLAVVVPGAAGRSAEPAPPVEPPVEARSAEAAALESAPPTPAIEPADPELLARLTKQLDDDRYGAREAAQKQLKELGLSALATVADVAAKGTLESSTRAVSVLLAWADGRDRQLSLAALEVLAELESRPTEAAMADERLAEVREMAAVEAIRKLGGRFDYDRYYGMLAGPQRAVQVIIGPDWKGGLEGLRLVADVRSATTLSLYSAPLGDDAADALAALSRVKRIELYGTELSNEALADLETKLPQTQFDVRRGGARLGIRGIDCQEVLPDSPAEKAGVKPQDRIVEFAGEPIDPAAPPQQQFDQLTRLIAKCKPGDRKPIKVQRLNPQNGTAETLELTVTFDRWGDDPRPTSGIGGGQDPFAVGRPGGAALQGQIIIQNGPGGAQIQVLPQVQPQPAPVEAQPLPADRR